MALYPPKGQYERVSRNVNGPVVKLRLAVNVDEIQTIPSYLNRKKKTNRSLDGSKEINNFKNSEHFNDNSNFLEEH